MFIADHKQEQVAKNIHELCQLAYRHEATLIGADEFPPLSLSTDAIQYSDSQWLVIAEAEQYLAAIEFAERENIEIHSLVVDPVKHRQGLASSLLKDLLGRFPGKSFRVQTARKNLPAILCYQKFGFEVNGQESRNDIEIVILEKNH